MRRSNIAVRGARDIDIDGSSATPPLAVIVPVLDEPVELPRLLAELGAQDLPLEIIVADGGSRDVPRVESPVRVVQAGRGRGRQMNAGAAASTATRLLFLHADSHLPRDASFLRKALDAFEREREQSGAALAGHFALRFRRTQPGRERLFRFMEAKTRSNRRGSVNGDQGLLIGRDFFGALGGFDEDLPFFEDARLARRVFERGRWLLLPGELETSARRFEAEGHAQRYALMGLMVAMHEAGCDEFLRAAPGVYAQQAETRRLVLTPFLRLARRQLLARLRRDPACVRAWGRVLRANAWQLDLACQGERAESVNRWERCAASANERPAADALLGIAAAGLGLVLPELAAGAEALGRLRR